MTRFSLPAVALLALAACSGGPSGSSDGGDGGLPDICNAPDAGDPQCELNIIAAPASDAGIAGQTFYIDHVGKDLYLWIQLPATVAPQTLFHLVAGYDAPSTPVDLAISLLTSNLQTSLGNQVDNHGAGKPHVLDFTFSFNPTLTPPGSIVWVKASDSGNRYADVHNPFSIYVDLVPDPDQNVGVTPITLGAATNGEQTGICANGDGGACQGVLSVEGREDAFSVSIPSSVTRPILYMNLSAATLDLVPPPFYDLAYTIADDAGTVINCGSVPNPFVVPNLATALLVAPGATYTIDVFGLNPNDLSADPCSGPDQAAGDLRVTYALAVEVLPDLDTNEPDDTLGETLSHPIAFTSPGDSQMLTGRLSYVNDADWYYLTFPSTPANTRLHYKITPGTAPGRYPAVGATVPGPDRLATLTLDISGQNATPACLQDSVQCPRDATYTGNATSEQGQLFNTLCNEGDGDGGALCLLSSRNEPQATEEGFTPLQNFEGIFPLQGTGAQSLFLNFKSSSGSYCDDVPYTLLLDWEPMPGQPASSVTSPIVTTLPFNESGVLAAGYGYLVQYNLTEAPPVDVRAQFDYDAVPSNIDTYEIDVPASFQSAPLGASWGLSWTLTDATTGMPAESLLLGVTFCKQAGFDGGGVVCDYGGPILDGIDGVIYFNSIDYHPWWDPNGQGWYTQGEFDALWDQTPASAGYTVTSDPFACTCFQPDYLAGGKLYVTVQGADRTFWTDTNYTLNMTIGAYPSTFVLDGGVYTCPTSQPDPLGVVDAGVDAGVDGGFDAGLVQIIVQVLVDAGYPQGCQFIDGFTYQPP